MERRGVETGWKGECRHAGLRASEMLESRVPEPPDGKGLVPTQESRRTDRGTMHKGPLTWEVRANQATTERGFQCLVERRQAAATAAVRRGEAGQQGADGKGKPGLTVICWKGSLEKAGKLGKCHP